MRKLLKQKIHNESKKTGIQIIEKKINLMTPIYIHRKINLSNIQEKKSQKGVNPLINENRLNITIKKKNSNNSIKSIIMNSIEVNRNKEAKNEKFHQKSNLCFISKTLSHILNNKKYNKSNKKIGKIKKLDLNENKENISTNYNDKSNISINLNHYNNFNKLENNLNINNMILQNNSQNGIFNGINNLGSNSSISQRNNFIKKKIITFGNKKNDFLKNLNMNFLTNERNSKESDLSDNRTQNIRKIYDYMNENNCYNNRLIQDYKSNNIYDFTNNNKYLYDNSFIGNSSSLQKRKISLCDYNNTPDSNKNFLNYRLIEKSENRVGKSCQLDNILSFRKVKPKIFYKSPVNKSSKTNLPTNKISVDFLENQKKYNYNKKSFVLNTNLIKYPSSRDTTFKKLNIKNNININNGYNQNSYFSMNYTNTDTNDNTSMDSGNQKIIEKMKKNYMIGKKNNLKLNKDNNSKKSKTIKEYSNKENRIIEGKFLKNNNNYSSGTIKYNYNSYDKDRFKKLSHRTLSNFKNKLKKESNLKDPNNLLLGVLNDKELSLLKKGKKLSKSNSSLHHNNIYRYNRINVCSKNKNEIITPHKTYNKQINKLATNSFKSTVYGENHNSKKNEKISQKNEFCLIKNDKINENSNATISQKYNPGYLSKSSSNSSFVVNDEIKNANIINSGTNVNIKNDNKNINIKVIEDENRIGFDILYTLESKLKNLLIKINRYQICYNECQDWLSFYFGINFYEKVLVFFSSEQNKSKILYFIKFELLCYFICYDISFNKNYSQASILLKTIFNLLHKNYLSLISFIIKKINENKEKENNIANDNNYIEQMILTKKLQEVIKNELKMNLGIQEINESIVLQIFSDNFKQIKNYYEMIIENVYSNINESNNSNISTFDVNNSNKKYNYFNFPECIRINIFKLNDKKKIYIISQFFKSTINSIDLFTIKEFKVFFNLYLNKSTDNLFIQQFFNSKRVYSLIPCPPLTHSLNPDKKILPPINAEKYNYTLILDLDETLIYLEKEYYTFNNIHNIKNKKLTLRPGLFNFLDRMKKIYEIVLFTFSSPEYANPIIQLIEKEEKYFEHILYIQYASYYNGEYVKNISNLGRDFKTTIIVDDNINIIKKCNRDNTICIKPFYGDNSNEKNTLQLLGNILNKIRYDAEITGDITKSLKKEKYNIITEISSNLEE